MECDGLGVTGCPACDGFGDGCSQCGSSGSLPCLPCQGDGVCPRCRGEGEIESLGPPTNQ
ncbi:MAG: hypothetical protein HYS09_04295 [Chloroflexi bacterium]|nr:hypothetical protein [Chloroflexota bacterium]